MARKTLKQNSSNGSVSLPHFLADAIRFSVLFSRPREKFQPIWERIATSPPETISERPAQKIRQEIGTIEGLKFSFTSQAFRSDMLVVPHTPNEPSAPLTHLGTLSNVLAGLETTLAEWLNAEAIENVDRVAFACTLTAETPKMEDAVSLFTQVLPNVRIGEGAVSDLLFQINRKRTLNRYPDIAVNRLAKWHTIELQTVQIEHGGGRAVSSACALQLEFDVNTAPGQLGSVKTSDYIEIIHELMALGDDVAQRGDVH